MCFVYVHLISSPGWEYAFIYTWLARDMLPKQAERSRLLFLSVTSGAVSLQTTHPERLASRHSVSGISPRVGGRANNQNGQRLEPKMTVAKHANPPF